MFQSLVGLRSLITYRIYAYLSSPVTFIHETDGSTEDPNAEDMDNESIPSPSPEDVQEQFGNNAIIEDQHVLHPPAHNSSPQQISASTSPYSCQQDRECALSHREASLMRSFIQKIAPWVRNQEYPATNQ